MRKGHENPERSEAVGLRENDGAIMAAKAKGIAHGSTNGLLPRFMGNVVEITVGIRGLQIDGGCRHTMRKRQHRDDSFNGSRASHGMTYHRFLRTDE